MPTLSDLIQIIEFQYAPMVLELDTEEMMDKFVAVLYQHLEKSYKVNKEGVMGEIVSAWLSLVWETILTELVAEDLANKVSNWAPQQQMFENVQRQLDDTVKEFVSSLYDNAPCNVKLIYNKIMQEVELTISSLVESYRQDGDSSPIDLDQLQGEILKIINQLVKKTSTMFDEFIA